MDLAGSTTPTHRQPWLHELAVCVDGNSTALSHASGQMHPTGAQGYYVDDRRILGLLTVSLGAEPSAAVSSASSGASSDFFASARHLGDAGPDPTIEIHRSRRLSGGEMTETIRVVSRASSDLTSELVVELGGDGASIALVKAGIADWVICQAAGTDRRLTWRDDWHAVSATFDPPPNTLIAASSTTPSRAEFVVNVPAGGSATVCVKVRADRLRASNLDANPGSTALDWSAIAAEASDPRLGPVLAMGFRDLHHLLLTDPQCPQDVFAAAGTPWYLTLFGRDSLWAARMVLPFGTTLAGGTLRSLARRQGTRQDAKRAESPGKIPHEVRRTAYGDPTTGLDLPPVYYGTVDATPLWITLLRDAQLWGLPTGEVEQLLPALRAAARWLTESSAPDDDGLLKYLDQTGSGLANQGWKDSGDSIRWRDGRVADAPIALVEAQGYAVEAANAAADLFDAFGQAGAADLRQWADELSERIRARYWIGETDQYLGIAVDGHGSTVDGIASNMGHLLGTGALTSSEVDAVARVLTSKAMLGDYGINTLSSENGGFNPMGYHTGSIWTHDTAICAWGLAREGRRHEASVVARTLLASAAAFDYRWPELYAGSGAGGQPAPYPASCRPQAWAAASAAVLVSVALGFDPNAAKGTLTLRPTRPAPYGAMTVRGLEFAGRRFAIACDAEGTTEVLDPPDGVDIQVL